MMEFGSYVCSLSSAGVWCHVSSMILLCEGNVSRYYRWQILLFLRKRMWPCSEQFIMLECNNAEIDEILFGQFVWPWVLHLFSRDRRISGSNSDLYVGFPHLLNALCSVCTFRLIRLKTLNQFMVRKARLRALFGTGFHSLYNYQCNHDEISTWNTPCEVGLSERLRRQCVMTDSSLCHFWSDLDGHIAPLSDRVWIARARCRRLPFRRLPAPLKCKQCFVRGAESSVRQHFPA
jgi:hypothetical protein